MDRALGCNALDSSYCLVPLATHFELIFNIDDLDCPVGEGRYQLKISAQRIHEIANGTYLYIRATLEPRCCILNRSREVKQTTLASAETAPFRTLVTTLHVPKNKGPSVNKLPF